MSLRSVAAECCCELEVPRNTRYQKRRQVKAAPLFRHFPRGNDEIRLCARVTRLGGPIAFLKRVKILTEGTDSVTECLIILGDSLASLDTPSQKVFVCQNTSKKMKNGGEPCDWLCKSMGLATRGATRGVMRGTPRGATRGATQGAMRVVMNKVWREQPK